MAILDWTVIVFTALLAAGLASLSAAVMRMPSSTYVRFVQLSAIVSIFPPIAQLLVTYVPRFSTPLCRGLANFVGTIGTTIFFCAELEFLKLLSPFVGHKLALQLCLAQVVVVFAGIASTSGNFTDIFTAFRMRLSLYAVVVLQCPMIMCDVVQRVYLLHFVFKRLRGASMRFRIGFSVITLSCIPTVTAAVLVLFLSPNTLNAWRLLGTTLYWMFELLSLVGTLMLREALQRARSPDRPKVNIMKRLSHLKTRVSRHMRSRNSVDVSSKATHVSKPDGPPHGAVMHAIWSLEDDSSDTQ
nr:hypothetical protein HK105_008098 [Polyrhizophydium stewartii]